MPRSHYRLHWGSHGVKSEAHDLRSLCPSSTGSPWGVTDGARTRDLRSHNPPPDVARCSFTGQSTHIQAKSRVRQHPATAGPTASVVYAWCTRCSARTCVVPQVADDRWLFNGASGRVTSKRLTETRSATRSPTGRHAQGEEHRRRRERRADERRGSATAALPQRTSVTAASSASVVALSVAIRRSHARSPRDCQSITLYARKGARGRASNPAERAEASVHGYHGAVHEARGR